MKTNFHIAKQNPVQGSTILFHSEKLLSASQNDTFNSMI